jgi:CRISPR-associated protein (TIGR03986 family)
MPDGKSVSQRRSPYRFLNPYNFVRPLAPKQPDVWPLLGRCAPPPHDRHLALTGRISARLTTTTPLFIADSEDIREEPPGHYHYRFFSYGGRPAIPATSLRGAVRSVFEAVTSSCFSVFDAGRRLSYHLPPGEALKLVPARVVRRDAGWGLELLTGTTALAVGQRPQGPQYAAWLCMYRPMQASRTLATAPGTPYARRRRFDHLHLRRGQECQAIIELIEHPTRHFQFWNVVNIAPKTPPELRPGPGQRRVVGYLCITNQNIENKHDERLFFKDGGPPITIELPVEARQRYEELIQDYQERHAAEVEHRRSTGEPVDVPAGSAAALSWFIYERRGSEEHKLQEGDLVYTMLEGPPSKPRVWFIVPVSVPRVGYDHAIGELLEPETAGRTSLRRKCDMVGRLCPACRLFGWVKSEAEEAQGDEPVAYAGRVRFSHGRLIESPGTLDDGRGIPLAILSAPKPTTTRFYLRPRDGRPQNGLDDEQAGYDGPNRLRGRKFYRHHGERLSEAEYRSPGDARSDQNRTIHGVLRPGSVFEFTVDFENLAAVELGALLWSLEMEGWHHRLGLGKPLGFGSARIAVTGLGVLDTAERYSSLAGGWRDALRHKQSLVERFQRAMAERYGKPFGDLDNVRDLRALLAATPQLPVHYPRPTRAPAPDGRNYEWFIGNKRSGRDAGPRLALLLPEDDRAGLPLLDRYGRTEG